jgi:polar amino acid transport system substrate-binding protein
MQGSRFLSTERKLGRILLSATLLIGLSAAAFGQAAPTSEIARGGRLRVGMIAITVLGGVAEPIARFIWAEARHGR